MWYSPLPILIYYFSIRLWSFTVIVLALNFILSHVSCGGRLVGSYSVSSACCCCLVSLGTIGRLRPPLEGLYLWPGCGPFSFWISNTVCCSLFLFIAFPVGLWSFAAIALSLSFVLSHLSCGGRLVESHSVALVAWRRTAASSSACCCCLASLGTVGHL